MNSYTIPNVIAQHPRGERIMDVYSHLLTERIVCLLYTSPSPRD